MRIASRSTGEWRPSIDTAASRSRRSRHARLPTCSRSHAPTTYSPASMFPATVERTPSMSPCRSPEVRGCMVSESWKGCRRPASSSETGAVTGVRTAYGDIEAEYVVNCAGMWARQLGDRQGSPSLCRRPSTTTSSPSRWPSCLATWPVIEDPASYGYYREEVGGLMIGLFEPVCAPWQLEAIPEDFSFGILPPDWDRMGPYVEKAMARVPDVARHRYPHLLLRSRELHSRPAADRRRGARAAQLLRGGGAQLDRDPHRGRAGSRRRPVDRRR